MYPRLRTGTQIQRNSCRMLIGKKLGPLSARCVVCFGVPEKTFIIVNKWEKDSTAAHEPYLYHLLILFPRDRK